MAQKRMFDRAIIDTDKFMDLPMSAKALYFLLGMEADDEGFVSYKKVLRIHGGNEDDVKVLTAKGFLIAFPSGVVVITDWNENNYIDKNRVKPTQYQPEKAMLLTEGRKYVFNNGLTRVGEGRIGYSGEAALRIESVTKEEEPRKPKADTSYLQVFALWSDYPLQWRKNRTEIDAARNLLVESNLEDMKQMLKIYERYKDSPFCPSILKPSDLDRKWDNLLDFKKKHG